MCFNLFRIEALLGSRPLFITFCSSVGFCQISQVTQGANCPIRSFPLLVFSYPSGIFPLERQVGCGLISLLSLLSICVIVIHLAWDWRGALYSLTEHTIRCSHISNISCTKHKVAVKVVLDVSHPQDLDSAVQP